jgi:hypothetical protein
LELVLIPKLELLPFASKRKINLALKDADTWIRNSERKKNELAKARAKAQEEGQEERKGDSGKEVGEDEGESVSEAVEQVEKVSEVFPLINEAWEQMSEELRKKYGPEIREDSEEEEGEEWEDEEENSAEEDEDESEEEFQESREMTFLPAEIMWKELLALRKEVEKLKYEKSTLQSRLELYEGAPKAQDLSWMGLPGGSGGRDAALLSKVDPKDRKQVKAEIVKRRQEERQEFLRRRKDELLAKQSQVYSSFWPTGRPLSK